MFFYGEGAGWVSKIKGVKPSYRCVFTSMVRFLRFVMINGVHVLRYYDIAIIFFSAEVLFKNFYESFEFSISLFRRCTMR